MTPTPGEGLAEKIENVNGAVADAANFCNDDRVAALYFVEKGQQAALTPWDARWRVGGSIT
jgi:hypothetical protein